MTVSVAAPISNDTLRVAGTPASIFTSCTTAFLKPGASTVTMYVPAPRDGIVKVPLLDVFILNSAPVALFLTTTEAPERTAPVASDTVPESGAVVPLWPNARKLFNARKLVMARSRSKDRLIQNLLPGWFWGCL